MYMCVCARAHACMPLIVNYGIKLSQEKRSCKPCRYGEVMRNICWRRGSFVSVSVRGVLHGPFLVVGWTEDMGWGLRGTQNRCSLCSVLLRVLIDPQEEEHLTSRAPWQCSVSYLNRVSVDRVYLREWCAWVEKFHYSPHGQWVMLLYSLFQKKTKIKWKEREIESEYPWPRFVVVHLYFLPLVLIFQEECDLMGWRWAILSSAWPALPSMSLWTLSMAPVPSSVRWRAKARWF